CSEDVQAVAVLLDWIFQIIPDTAWHLRLSPFSVDLNGDGHAPLSIDLHLNDSAQRKHPHQKTGKVYFTWFIRFQIVVVLLSARQIDFDRLISFYSAP